MGSIPPSINNNDRTYLKGYLTNPLQLNKNYCLSFYYNASNRIMYSTNRFGAFIDDGSISSYDCWKSIPIIPQVQNNPSFFMSDTLNWVKIQGSFTAIGNENTITLGNFVDSSTVQFQLFNSSGTRGPYYNIDDVSLIPIDLPPWAGRDTTIKLGDSTYIGRPSEVGLDDDCTWYLQGNSTPIDTVAGLWVKPSLLGIYSFVVEQNICGTITYDTVNITIIPNGIEYFNTVGKIFVYPNPGSDQFFISGFEANQSEIKVELYDVAGSLLLQQTLPVQNGLAKLNMQVSSGVYLLRFISGNGIDKQQKLIINR
ncbi:MAG: T9SS type A sorting domain-containing protein [Bacteroidia bacterium]